MEASIELVLPLLRKAAGTNHQATVQVPAGDQLFDEETGHDGLTSTRVISEQETEGLARQHGRVDRRDLVREGLDERGVNGEHGIEQMRQAGWMRCWGQPEQW